MNRDGFKSWLTKHTTLDVKPVGDYISRCGRVERGSDKDLDEDYTLNGMGKIFEDLEYIIGEGKAPVGSRYTFRNPDPEKVRKAGSDMRSAVRAYMCYCAYKETGKL